MTDVIDEKIIEHEHNHEHGVEHTHEGMQAIGPQPVPQMIEYAVSDINDGTRQLAITFSSLNGNWTVFFTPESAIAFAQRILGDVHGPMFTQHSVTKD